MLADFENVNMDLEMIVAHSQKNGSLGPDPNW